MALESKFLLKCLLIVIRGGGGAPLKDQNGQMITTRTPHMNKQFERNPQQVKGILKKADEKFDYFRSDLKSRAGT